MPSSSSRPRFQQTHLDDARVVHAENHVEAPETSDRRLRYRWPIGAYMGGSVRTLLAGKAAEVLEKMSSDGGG